MALSFTRRAFLNGAGALALWPRALPAASPHAARLWERPDGTATDGVMVRRLHLDLAGRLPTKEEAQAYVASSAPDKRERLTEALLASQDFADYWTMRFCDCLRVKSEFPVNLWPNAVYVYHARIRSFVASDEPWDVFARALLTAQGSNFRDAEVNFFRATDARTPDGWAQAVAQTFLGVAPADLAAPRRAAFAAHFSNVRIKTTREWKEEIVYVDGPDRRAALWERIFLRERPAAAAAFRTRLARWIFGPSTAASPAGGRITGVKTALREIVLSPAYARGSVTGGFPARRLDAEVLDDTFCTLSGFPRDYQSPAPEPFTYLPPERKTVCIEDGSLSSGFLSLFGRPARDTGRMDERGLDVTAKQRLYLFNSLDLHRKLGALVMPQRPSAAGVPAHAPSPPLETRLADLYWRLLSRAPSEPERRAIAALRTRRRERPAERPRGKGNASDGELLRDVAWCLMNTKEFLFRL